MSSQSGCSCTREAQRLDRPLRRTDSKGTLLCLPLLFIALIMCVGVLEELLFRGFLFRGTLARAVVVTGVTFAIGHAVNAARGYRTGRPGRLGLVLGIVLALLFATIGTHWPLVAFHAVPNTSGTSRFRATPESTP
ncbi:CPBP family intramembrane glutamic endopeptidase [Arthrobacter crystallopoietes]|uniref:CPBP family intramembrane glutamic endopeptidase n=1 Tax=Crystallibacter crystallopoietes TaxID=37928 RepID=UPI00196AE31C|nr:CPBP family intramembrane glutamic endopeptidase [Arthrobacter crystallopoietes]